MTSTRVSIGRDWKISEVLKHYPELLDVLIDSAPAFEKLRNPILRKVQSRLVTVEQAARIGGIDPGDLTVRLNEAAGLEIVQQEPAEPPDGEAKAQQPAWVREIEPAVSLDVRPFQERGEEPFSAIMAAVRGVDQGEVMLLRNTFEPVPLYDVLGQRGFEHWTQQLGADDWEVRFFHSGQKSRHRITEDLEPDDEPAEGDWSRADASVEIDVSELVPPEPMVKILAALEELPAGGSLYVQHLRKPMFLYPQLDELGYRHQTRVLAPDRVELLIEKPLEPDRD